MMQPRLTLNSRSIGFFPRASEVAFSVLMKNLLDDSLEDAGGVMVSEMQSAMHPSTTTSWLTSANMRASGEWTSATTADSDGFEYLKGHPSPWVALAARAVCAARRSSGRDNNIRDPSLFEKVINKLTLAGILRPEITEV